MYRFSRSIYREIGPAVMEDCYGSCENKQRVLDACETAMRRLAHDRRHFARPARSLFRSVRAYFAIADQEWVYRTIERYVGLACEHLDQLPDTGYGLDGSPIACQAQTRQGSPCQRKPRPGSDYCPSHRHLEELDRRIEAQARRLEHERAVAV